MPVEKLQKILCLGLGEDYEFEVSMVMAGVFVVAIRTKIMRDWRLFVFETAHPPTIVVFQNAGRSNTFSWTLLMDTF